MKNYSVNLKARQAVVIALILSCLSVSPLEATTHLEPSQICDQVARIAAQKTGVPLSVLQAITRTETGRKTDGSFGPWPWTVNMEGKGVWFDTLDQARSYVFRHFKQGARSFDVGCFQINYKWHHQAFSSIDEMFDPMANATYAAEFLKSLFDKYGNWTDAAGAYHSRTPKYANRYKAIFERHRKTISDPQQPVLAKMPKTVTTATRVNSFPLLQQAGNTQLGSLVPISDRAVGAGFLAIVSSVGG